MKYSRIIGLMLVGAFVFSGTVMALAGKDKPVPQTVCPITGGKINKNVHHDFNGKRVYFCCAGCIDKFAKAPEKYIKKMELKGIALAKAPVPQTQTPPKKKAKDADKKKAQQVANLHKSMHFGEFQAGIAFNKFNNFC